MRITEFTNAEDTLALWKTISDNTWAAIAQQAEAEAKQKAERAAARKSASKRGSGKSTAKPAPPKRLPPPLQHVSAPVAKDTKPANEPSTKTSPPQQARDDVGKQARMQKAVGMAQPQPMATTPQAAQVQQPQATQLLLTPQQQRLQRQNAGVVVKNAAAGKSG